MALGMPPTSLNAASRTLFAIAPQDSPRMTRRRPSMRIVQDTVQWKIATKILRNTTKSRNDTVPYYTHDMTCTTTTYLVTQQIRELRLGRSAFRSSVRAVNTRSSLASENNGISLYFLYSQFTIPSHELLFSMRSILSVSALGAFLVVFLFVNMFISLSCRSEITKF